MAKRFAKEWLWLLGCVIAAIGLSIKYRGSFWRVGETGVLLASLYVAGVVVRTTMWAVRTVWRTAIP